MTPSRWRSLLLFCCLIVVLAFGLFAASQSDLVRARLLAWTQGILADVLGREVAIEQVKIQPWVGRLELIQLRIAQEKSLKDGVLLSAERIRVGWSWSALLRRQFVLRRVALVHPQLTLPTETDAGAKIGRAHV